MAHPVHTFRDVGLIDQARHGPRPLPNPSLYDRVMHIYRRSIATLVIRLTQSDHEELAVTIGTLLAEPYSSICAALCYPFAYLGFPPSLRLDPVGLSTTEAQLPALFCLHGMLHNRSGWTALGKFLSDREQQFNVYTITLSEDDDVAMEQARERITEICAQYAEHEEAAPVIHFIGHSRGGWLASRLCDEQRARGQNPEGKVARLGAPYPTEQPESTCDLLGDYDVIVGERELEDAVATSYRYPKGHLRLLLHMPALRTATEFLLAN